MQEVNWRQRLNSEAQEYLAHLSHQERAGASRAGVQLNIAVIGGGIGGLACAVSLRKAGHKVVLYDAQPTLQSVGYGIQVAPNLSRLLWRLGVGPYLKDKVTRPQHLIFRRWENGNPLGIAGLGEFEKRYGSPYFQVNRGHMHAALHEKAREIGVRIQVNSQVVKYNVDEPSVSLSDGTTVRADLVVSAEGSKSKARAQIVNDTFAQAKDDQFNAFRVIIDVEHVREDPDLQHLVDYPHQNAWIGPNRHVMVYPINGNQMLNMVLIAPFRDSKAGISAYQEFRSNILDWDSRLRKLVDLGTSARKWPIKSAVPLPRMVTQSHKLVIIGDAAHDMTPYLGQGAAMAVEDAVLLGRVLSSPREPTDIAHALDIFDAIRVPRTTAIRREAINARDRFHMVDGPDQQERDFKAANEMTGQQPLQNLCTFTDPVTQRWLYEYDVEKQLAAPIMRPRFSKTERRVQVASL